MYSDLQGVRIGLTGFQMYQHQASLLDIVYSIKPWYNAWLDRLVNLISAGDQKESKILKPDDSSAQEESGAHKQDNGPTQTESEDPEQNDETVGKESEISEQDNGPAQTESDEEDPNKKKEDEIETTRDAKADNASHSFNREQISTTHASPSSL